ncbi:MAG: restriction endonuclease [Clostridiales bacterium]|nr:restriction endonuclease [Clostridiales bacterium]
MTSPFDSKNRLAAMLDRLALRLVLFALCVLYFLRLWKSGPASLLAGIGLFVLVLVTLALLEQRTLTLRDRLLRERAGGMIALEELLLMPSSRAADTVCSLLCSVLDAQPLGGAKMLYEGETWLVRCAQCVQGSNASEGDVLAAHRARVEADADKCALISTGGFSPAATRAAEWMEPPVRLIGGRQLAQLAGRLHPATDEEIARHARRARVPFSFARIRALALAPAKLRRYLVCAFLLLLLYLLYGSLMTLAAALLSYLLAILCARENRRTFRL